MNALRGWYGSTFAAASIPAFRRYLYALTATFFALWMVSLARGYIVFDLTGSSAALGGVFIAFGVPQLLLSLVGGVAADRLPRQRVVLAAVLAFGLEYAIIGLLVALGRIEYWMILLAAVFEGASIAFYIPARVALIADLVGDRGVGNGMVLQQVSFNSARVAGPLVAGGLIAMPAIGAGGSMLIAGGLFGVAAAVVLGLPRVPPRAARVAESPLRQVAGGISYVRGRPALVILVLTSYVTAALAFPYIAFLPALVKDVYGLGSVALGALNATIAIGALAAALLAASIVEGPSAWRWQAVATAGFVVVLMVFAVAPVFPLALLVGALLGAGEIGFVSLNQALAMRFSEPEFHGRVQSLLVVGFALFGIAALPVGFVADVIGVRQTLFLEGAAATTLLGGIFLYARALRAAADARAPSPAPADEAASAPAGDA